MVSPCVLVASCSSLKPSELVKQILAVDELPTSVCLLEDIQSFPWHIETKYYTAEVSVCSTETRTVGDQSFADAIQAFIVTFDSKEASSFDQVISWLPYLKELKPAVQLLVCDQCSDDDAVSRHHALHWCIDNSFEFVELNSSSADSDDSDEDDFKETVGIQRIVEALSCHSWPNLVMKENPTFRSPYFQQIMNEAARTMLAANSITKNESSASIETNGATQYSSVEKCTDGSCDPTADATVNNSSSTDTKSSDATGCGADTFACPPPVKSNNCEPSEAMGTGTTDGCTDEESFEQLFERLQIMKEAASGMPLEDRKKYAEQVTMQFWQAIGGNADEFEGLSDLSDSD